MADLPPYSTPRWVKVSGTIALVLVLLVGIILLTGLGGEHGPGRHMPSSDAGGHTPPLAQHSQTAMTMAPGLRTFALTTHFTSERSETDLDNAARSRRSGRLT